MASPPPPYDNITGISRAVMKDNAQETLANYNGNARPGELVVNLVTDPPALYVGNNSGALTAISSGGGSTGNITFTDTTMSPPDGVDIFITAANSEVEITGLDFRVDVTDDVRITGSDIVSLRNRSATEDITITTDLDGNAETWTFAVDSTLSTPGDIVVNGTVSGTVGSSTLYVAAQPSSNTYIQLNNTVDSTIQTHANLEIITDASNTSATWTFDTAGTLTAAGNISAGNIGLSGNITSIVSVTDPQDFDNLTPINGGRAFVTNANLVAAGNFGAQISGGGSNTVPVWSDGANWYIG